MKTVEENKLLERLEKAKGEVRYTHASEHDEKRESIAIVKIEDKYFHGSCTLSHQDRFSKKIARVITLGRAMKNFQAGIEYKNKEAIDNFYKKNKTED